MPIQMRRPFRSEVTKVTPDLAIKWLEKNKHNRPLRESVVEKYAKDMREGRWGLSHQGIAIDPEGNILDGQHRLWAILSAQVPIEFVVFWDVDPEAQQYIDQGLSRTAVDVLRLGGDERANTYRLAVARQAQIGTRAMGGVQMSRQEHIEFYERHKKAIDFVVEECFQNKKVMRCNPAPVGAVLMRAYYHEDHDRLKEFGRILLDGMPKSEKDAPAILLRNWLLAGSIIERTHRIARPTLQYMKAQRALVAFLRGEVLRMIYVMKDEQWSLPDEVRRQSGTKLARQPRPSKRTTAR